jgi:asparagine synthase (glutamine-hydrolysing)
MSGVFGFIDPTHSLAGKDLLDEMTSVLSHRPWYESVQVKDEPAGVSIGRIGIGIFNKGQEPCWNAERTTVLLLSGEIYNLPPHVPSPEQALLERYREVGERFVQDPNGSFILALWDAEKEQLLIANDRFGTYPLFYSFSNGRLVFAPELKGVLVDGGISRDLDLAGVAQYMRFQQFLGDRTPFAAVKYLRGASILKFRPASRSLAVSQYWTYADIPDNQHIPFKQAVEQTGYLLRQVVARQSSEPYRAGIFLSGGLDSRLILGLTERRPVVTMTFGREDSRDVHYAALIAEEARSDHIWFDLPDGKWVEENADFHWTLTEGMHSWIHMHSITMLPEARQCFDVNLSGMAGGTLLKSPKVVDPERYAEVDDLALVSRLFMVMNLKHTWPGLDEAEERLLYTPEFMKKVQGLAFDSFLEELKPYLQYRSDIRGEYFFVDQHNMRFINNMAVFGRSHIEFRHPYLDSDLVDFVYSLPVAHRLDNRFIRALISREVPVMAKIPYDADEFLPTENSLVRSLSALTVKTKRRFNRYIFHLFPEWKTLYADYEEYLRGDLRPWAEGILLEPRTLERGIFSPAALRSLMDRHIAGKEEWTIGKIAPLISFEMSLRRLVDGDAAGLGTENASLCLHWMRQEGTA